MAKETLSISSPQPHRLPSRASDLSLRKRSSSASSTFFHQDIEERRAAAARQLRSYYTTDAAGGEFPAYLQVKKTLEKLGADAGLVLKAKTHREFREQGGMAIPFDSLKAYAKSHAQDQDQDPRPKGTSQDSITPERYQLLVLRNRQVQFMDVFGKVTSPPAGKYLYVHMLDGSMRVCSYAPGMHARLATFSPVLAAGVFEVAPVVQATDTADMPAAAAASSSSASAAAPITTKIERVNEESGAYKPMPPLEYLCDNRGLLPESGDTFVVSPFPFAAFKPREAFSAELTGEQETWVRSIEAAQARGGSELGSAVESSGQSPWLQEPVRGAAARAHV